MSVFLKRRGPAPVLGKLLSDYAEGDIVLLNENGSPVEFYVAKHNYESGLNGAGRTLLVRKDCYSACAWYESRANAYATSAIDSFLNSTYKAILDDAVGSAIGTTKFYYTPGNGNSTVGTLERSVFLMSVTELGKSATYAKVEGSALPIASTLQIADHSRVQWTRTPFYANSYGVYYLNSSGNVGTGDSEISSYYSRPIFTLPGVALFDFDTNKFIKAA